MQLTQQRLKDILHYDSKTGLFTWKISTSRAVKVGQQAGTLVNGYIKIRVDWKVYFAHRLAWLYTYGLFPSQYIDHFNRNKLDNSIKNLRDVSMQDNQKNRNTTKDSRTNKNGVNFEKGKYKVTVGGSKNRVYGGYHKSLKKAIKVRKKLETKLNYIHV